MNKFALLVALCLSGWMLSGCASQQLEPTATSTISAIKTAKPTYTATQTGNSIKPAYTPAYTHAPTEAISATPTPTTIADFKTIYPANPIPPALLAAMPSASNDRLIAFSSESHADNYFGYSDIYTMQLDGSNLKQLTQYTGNDERPTWSKDGKKILFYTDRSDQYCTIDTCNWEKFIMNLEGTDAKKLMPDMPEFIDPDLSPDGKYSVHINHFYDPLRLQHGMGDNLSDILIETIGSSHQQNITGALQPGVFWNIRWSATGKQFAFTGTTSPYIHLDQEYGGDGYRLQDVYLINADGSAMQKLPGGSFWSSQNAKAWSPDGERLAFLTTKGIATVQADGSGFLEYAIEKNIGWREVFWPGAGDQLVFTDADDQYYKINADFTGLQKLPIVTEIDKLIYRFELLQVQTIEHGHTQMVLSPNKKWIAYFINSQFRVISTETRESYFVHNSADTINAFKDFKYPVYAGTFGNNILWSPDSRQLIFTQSIQYEPIFHPYQQLFAIQLDGTSLHKIAENAWFPEVQP